MSVQIPFFLKREIGKTNQEGEFDLILSKEESAIYFVPLDCIHLKITFHLKE